MKKKLISLIKRVLSVKIYMVKISIKILMIEIITIYQKRKKDYPLMGKE